MIERFLRITFTIIGLLIGAAWGRSLTQNQWIMSRLPAALSSSEVTLGIYIFIILFFGLLFFILFPLIHSVVRKISNALEETLKDVRLADVGFSIAGLIIGLIIAMLLSFAFAQIPIKWLASILTAASYILLGYLGFALPRFRRDDILTAFYEINEDKNEKRLIEHKTTPRHKKQVEDLKILDTSVLIDGRILDIAITGFLQGTIGVPVYVLNELQLIADSSDDLKRQRGRRGLDIVAKMQAEESIQLEIIEQDYDDIAEVDAKLIRMAQEKKCKVLTNDFNLNKLASVQGITILNINDLANAVKPVVMPGEDMTVQLVKEGKGNAQAVAYLEDGTMIVVENAQRQVGKTRDVVVTSVLQTSAGRMIFAKLKNNKG